MRNFSQAWRESFLFGSIPVEPFVHDPETLTWFFEQDRQDGHPALIGMLTEGVVVRPRPEIARVFKDRAEQISEQAPPPLSTDASRKLRYTITDKLGDLEAEGFRSRKNRHRRSFVSLAGGAGIAWK